MSINLSLLIKAAHEKKISHLLLFHGSGSEKRKDAVLELASMLNCKEDQDTCCQCLSCKKMRSGNHPDFLVVSPVKNSIGIEQVLDLQSGMSRKTVEGKYRICLLEDANKLTLPAANALLKIAEEPPADTIIILSASNADSIISTLQSRAQGVYFPPPGEEEWAEQAETYCLSGGDPDLAKGIQELGLDRIKEWLNIYWETISTGNFLKLFALFPMEREESLLFLQALAAAGKERLVKGQVQPQFFHEIMQTAEVVRRQVNPRLALETMSLKHIRLGGTQNDSSSRNSV